jgi:uncharacterized membrane protein
MQREKIIEILERHQGKIIGSLIGFLVSVVMLTIGFFKTLFITICIIIGYYFGKKIDNRESIAELLDRILPPGILK